MKYPAIIAILFLFLSACGTDSAGSNTVINNTRIDVGTNNGNADVGVEDTSTEDTNVEVDMNQSTACTTTDDCDAPQVCALNDQGELECVDPTGGMNGATCTDGSECASGICLNGMCADPCDGEADCPAGFTCESNDIPTTAGSVTLNVCVEESQPCLSNTDCTDPEVCVVDLTLGASLECGPAVGNGEIGDACTMNDECQTNLCINNFCSAPCERPNDCATDGSSVCEPTMVATVNGGVVNIDACAPRPPEVCLSDADCAGNERCVATRSATDVEFGCGIPNANGGENGAACATDGDCAQNLCVDNVCSGPCQSNGDCSNAADFSCDLVMVDLGGGNSDSAQICAPPVMCSESDDCRANETCFIRQGQLGTVDLLCLSPNVGGGALNQVCSSNLECADNLCLPTRFRDVCTNACVDNGDCSEPGYSCQNLQLNGTTIDVCAPDTPQACTSNDDCGTGTVCAVILNQAGNGLESVCVPSTGGDAAGVACQDDNDCASLICNNGTCGAPCVDANDCPASQLCTSESVTKGNQTATLDLCTTPPDIQCTESSDCTDGVRVCGDLRLVNNVVTPFCGFPNAAGSQLGDTCAMDTDCRENVCLTGIANECSVVCNDNGDCGAGQGCTTYADIGFCNTTCADNGDCASGNFCTINGDTIDNDVDQVCQVAPGAKLLGDTCAAGGECQTGLCLTTFLYNGTPCTTAAQCSGAETCECPIDMPNCSTGRECATTTSACTNLCDDNGDCTGGIGGNQLTACSTSTVVPLPDGIGTKTIATCAQP